MVTIPAPDNRHNRNNSLHSTSNRPITRNRLIR